jgi:putative aldouronate transport system permease protein
MPIKFFTTGEKIFQFFAVGFMALFCAITLYPFIHIIAVSLSTSDEAVRPGLHIIPLKFSFAAYQVILADNQLWISMKNSTVRTVVATTISLMTMTFVAYPLSKKYLPHRKFITMFIVFTMYVDAGLIPNYLLLRSLGFMNSFWVFVIPSLVHTYWMLITRNFYMTLPAELEESGKIDGANDIRILFTIILPLSKPILATLALYLAVYHWNSWFDCMLFITDDKKMLLQNYLRRLIVMNWDNAMDDILDTSGGWNVLALSAKDAILFITMVPILILYPFLQKYFAKGMLIGSLKG